MKEQEENHKPEYEWSPLSNTIVIKFIVDFLMSIPESKEYRRKVFDAFEDELNMYPCKENGFKQGKYPFHHLQRSIESVRLFKDFYVSRFVSFSNHKFKGIKQKDGNIITPQVETDFKEFEYQARLLNINNAISRNNLYFDMKKEDFKQGIMRVYTSDEIYQYLLNNHYPYLEYEPKQESKQRYSGIKKDESKRMYSIDDLLS